MAVEGLVDAGLAEETVGVAVDVVAESGPASAAPDTPAPLGLSADATDELAAGAQSFAAVLKSIGNAVVVTQAALDSAFIDSAKLLSDTKLEVAVAVRQPLDDDGNLAGDPEVDTRTLSLSALILPTPHVLEYCTVSMDLIVGEIDATSGVKVRSGSAGGSISSGVGGFSAQGEFNYSSTNAENRLRADFSSGTVRLDTQLGPRVDFRFPLVNEFAIGPQVLVTQTATSGAEVPATGSTPRVPPFRTVTLTVGLVGRDGGKLTGKSIDVRLPTELRRRLKNPVSGSISTATPIVLNLDESFIGEPPQSQRVELKYGSLSKFVDVTL